LHGELQVLTRSGLTPAEVFRLTDRGRITPGARADLILVDGNTPDDIKATRAIARIFKNGYDVRRAPVEAAQPLAVSGK
jgi:imidazolonepropionase-like amidohydrolase